MPFLDRIFPSALLDGLAYRSCELDGVNGAEITVKFSRARDRRKERSGTRNAPA